MADFFNTLLSNFCKKFTSIKSAEDLTLGGTGMYQAMSDLKNYIKNDTKLLNRENDIVEPLWNALESEIPEDLDEQLQRAEKIKKCLDDLAKHKLIIGSVFVGIGTAKYWKDMSKACDKVRISIKLSISQVQSEAEEALKKEKAEEKRLDQKLKKDLNYLNKELISHSKNKEKKNKYRHNSDAKDLLKLWNRAIENCRNVDEFFKSVYSKVSLTYFQSIYDIISDIVKENGPLVDLVKFNGGHDLEENHYSFLYWAIKNTQYYLDKIRKSKNKNVL